MTDALPTDQAAALPTDQAAALRTELAAHALNGSLTPGVLADLLSRAAPQDVPAVMQELSPADFAELMTTRPTGAQATQLTISLFPALAPLVRDDGEISAAALTLWTLGKQVQNLLTGPQVNRELKPLLSRPCRTLLTLIGVALPGLVRVDMPGWVNADDLGTPDEPGALHRQWDRHARLGHELTPRKPGMLKEVYYPASISSFSSPVALGVLNRVAADHGTKPTLSPEDRLTWDAGLKWLSTSEHHQALEKLLLGVQFNPGDLSAVRNLEARVAQRMRAACPGVPAGQLRVTTDEAALAALKGQTPSLADALRKKRFAFLKPADPAMSFGDAVALAAELRDLRGLQRRPMTDLEHARALLSTEQYVCQGRLDADVISRLSDEDLTALTREEMLAPDTWAIKLLLRHAQRLPPGLQALLVFMHAAISSDENLIENQTSSRPASLRALLLAALTELPENQENHARS